MVKFAKAYTPKKLTNPYHQTATWLLAFLLVVMVVAQLVTLQDFVAVFQTYRLPDSESSTRVIAAVLVIAEVFALPFLLRMRLSKLMRIFSMLCGWLAVLIWLGLIWWALAHYLAPANVGYFGSLVNWPFNNIALIYAASLLVLMALASRLLRHDFRHKWH